MRKVQDELCIRRAQSGDADAFEQLLVQHQKSVYNLCLRMTGNTEDALDLSQEAFFRAWRAIGQYQFDAAFSTWLYRLTTNICIDFLRKRKKSGELSLTIEDDEALGEEFSIPDSAPGPEEQAIDNETRRTLHEAMQKLPADWRVVMQLRAVEELSYEQIADVLGIKVGTVKSRLARAREALRQMTDGGNFSDANTSNRTRKEVRAR